MAQFFLKIAHLSFSMGPTPILKMAVSYGLHPRLWLLPVLNPVFLARNRMVTRVVAKQAKTTKVKNKFVNGKKSSKEYSFVFLVKGEKFNLGQKKKAIRFRRKVQICLVGSVANSVGTPLEFAAFRSGFDAKYSRASAFWFFLSTTIVFTKVRTPFARKNTSLYGDRQLVTKKETSSKINTTVYNKRPWPSGLSVRL